MPHIWRGAGVVERGGLENRCSLRATEGSNPSLSARKDASVRARFYMLLIVPIEGSVFVPIPLRQVCSRTWMFQRHPSSFLITHLQGVIFLYATEDP